MKIFLDTSALFKLYHNEFGSGELKNLFQNFSITSVFLSEITKLEFASTAWKKVRKGDIDSTDAKILIEQFETDFKKYSFISIDTIINQLAANCLEKYGKSGLRTLDSLQLATCIFLTESVSLFLTYDNKLKEFLQQEKLPISLPDFPLNLETLNIAT